MSLLINFGDSIPNATSKDYTFPVAVRILWMFGTITLTGTAGSRKLQIGVYDPLSPTERRYYIPIANTATVPGTTYRWIGFPGTAKDSTFGTSMGAQVPIAYDWYIPEGWILRINELAAIDPLDDLTVYGQAKAE